MINAAARTLTPIALEVLSASTQRSPHDFANENLNLLMTKGEVTCDPLLVTQNPPPKSVSDTPFFTSEKESLSVR